MKPNQDRRFETRSPANARGVIVAPGLELPCLIADQSAAGMKLRLDRAYPLPPRVVVVDVGQALAIEVEVVWNKGLEAGVKRGASAGLRGLVPSRLAAARDAYMRAGGR